MENESLSIRHKQMCQKRKKIDPPSPHLQISGKVSRLTKSGARDSKAIGKWVSVSSSRSPTALASISKVDASTVWISAVGIPG